jgi:conjugative relaxase-like TrwC/TraI family protein
MAREPVNAQELAGQISKDSRPRTQALAGYDLTFSPVKSVSTLWAVADPAVAAAIERAHQAAVQDALTFLEKHALLTRTGPQGIRQVNVQGVVAAAFTHRDSRAGDPDLHTHVAVANKVQTLDGRWLSIDGRVLFKANVAASETYNTALEKQLRDRLRVRFAERPGTDPGKRPIREIIGVDPRLNQRWSTRRAHINTRRGELAIQFQHDHGRPPTPIEALQLALVAHHSGARFVARILHFDRQLEAYPFSQDAVSDALTVADQTVGPKGQGMTSDERMSDMLKRHGPNSPNALAHPQREPYLRAAAMRVAARLERGVFTVGSGASYFDLKNP